MLTRSSFWFGLLLGLLSAFFPRRSPSPTPRPVLSDPLHPLLDLVADSVLICDSSGAVAYANASARAVLGSDGSGLARLCYPSGQPVPPGQWPVNRVLHTGQAVRAEGYLFPGGTGGSRVLDVTARPWAGGAVAVFRDVTAMQGTQARAAAMAGWGEALSALGERLGVAAGAEEVARTVVDGARALLDDLPDARARLYVYDAGSKRLTLRASAPDDRPKRPRSQRQSLMPTFAFDAGDPLLWQVYVAKRPFVGSGAAALGEDSPAACALPLVTGGTVLGHLSVNCRDPEAFADPARMQALALLASLAASALAGRREAAQAQTSADQTAAVREVAQAVAGGQDLGALADLIAGHVCRITRAEVCTLAVRDEEGWSLVGAAYREALTFPQRHIPSNAALRDDCLAEALANRKTTQHLGRANPDLEAGPWRAFAGQSGRHSVLAVPLPGEQGGWTVYWAGDAPLPADQVKFLETLASLTAATMTATRIGR